MFEVWGRSREMFHRFQKFKSFKKFRLVESMIGLIWSNGRGILNYRATIPVGSD